MSNVGDYWKDDFSKRYPHIDPYAPRIWPITTNGTTVFNPQEEIAKLRKEMEELKLLLLAAKRYDEKMGEPDCEMDAKVILIKQIAKLVGVDMKDVFGDGSGVS
ncbi:MAG: hypothetical protein IM509_05390 [Microcystis sp. M31BS1]|uniref:hypothetical protein n=1 Tax=Microcystis sp. M31BS1 TaxID=2771186 RepID=UPI00258BA3CC|nr:hypothetical protein [Microcystis sp. M31BS1]MCA2590184.1 hypothetical protein [Microcystis sp. M31BS1]